MNLEEAAARKAAAAIGEATKRGALEESPDQFLTRVFALADDAALFLTGVPADQQSAWLQTFGYSVYEQWLQVFAPHMSPRDIDGMMIDVMERIRRRRDYLERFGMGSA